MNRAGMSLIVTTPLQVVVTAENVTSFRAADESGDFGIQPGHTDMLSVLKSCVVRWRSGGGEWRYCALHGGVMTVEDGNIIRIACREGVTGEDLPTLESAVSDFRAQEMQAASRARIGQARLHARAIRQIMRNLSSDHGVAVESALEEIFQ